MFVHPQTRSLLLDADPAVIAAAVPARAVTGPGFRVAAKHTPAATVTLREMGFDAPSPIVSYYVWPKFEGKHPPFDHQRLMAEYMTLYRRCFNLGEMGSGKTNSVYWAIDWCMMEKIFSRVVICAPLSTLERVWVRAGAKVVLHRRVAVVHGTREKRLAAIKSGAQILIVNHDGLTIGPVREALMRFLGDDGLLVVDEGSKFRNAQTDKYKALEKVCANPRLRLWWLTGTPTPTGPDDAWAQVRLVSPSRVPRFYGQFRDRVMYKVGDHLWKPRPDAARIVYDAMQPAIFISKSDCLDLPPITTQDMTCELSDEQKHAFKAMSRDMIVADQEARKRGAQIMAINAADKVNKLRQIMLGSIMASDGSYVTYDYSPRLRCLFDAIEQAKAKVIVVVPFKGILRDLEAKVSKHYSCAVVNGDVSIGKRNKIFADFADRADPRVLLCHPDVMSHGLSLTEADMLVFFGPMYGNDAFRQVIERYNRPPQDKHMAMVRIGCSRVEWDIYRSLDNDEDQQQSVLTLYRGIVGAA